MTKRVKLTTWAVAYLAAAHVVFAVISTASAVSAPWIERSWPSERTPRVVVRYHPDDEEHVQDLIDLVENARERFSSAAGMPVNTRVNVLAAPSDREFSRLTRNMVPEWSSACAVPSENLIIVAVNSHDKPLDFTIPHEVSHILLSSVSRYPVPRWFDEGLAMNIAGERTIYDSFRLARAAIFDTYIPLGRIDSVFTFHRDHVWLAYAESYAAVQWMIRTYGRSSLSITIQSLAHMPFNRALIAGTDQSTTEFERLWLENAGKGYALTGLADDFLIWTILLPGLFIIALGFRWWRNRKTMKRWEKEDEWYDDDDGPDEPLDERIANTY